MNEWMRKGTNENKEGIDQWMMDGWVDDKRQKGGDKDGQMLVWTSDRKTGKAQCIDG